MSILYDTTNMLTQPALTEWMRDLWFGSSHAAWDAGRSGESIFLGLVWFCLAWFVFLMGLVGYWVIKYRRRPGVAPQRSPSHNTVIEVAWTVFPSLCLVVMFFYGFHGYMDFVVSEGNALQYKLNARKWAWEIVYPNGTTTAQTGKIDADQTQEYPIFVIPADIPVEMRMSSEDVIHSFWVPDLRVKFDVFPNRYTSFQFRFDNLTDVDRANQDLKEFPGGYREHHVFCAEYCGDYHSEMAAIIRVVDKGDYLAWVETGGVKWEELSPIKAGATVWKVKGCASCHSTDGAANTGPTWKNLYGYESTMTDGTSILVDENHIRESVLVPGAKVRQGFSNQMPAYQGKLSEVQIEGIIAYLKSISDRAPATAEEILSNTEPTPTSEPSN